MLRVFFSCLFLFPDFRSIDINEEYASRGPLEKGKDANIVVSDGNILDIRTSQVSLAFIQGRQIDLDNKQKQLFRKYMNKYGLK
jgi:hypothetical protein